MMIEIEVRDTRMRNSGRHWNRPDGRSFGVGVGEFTRCSAARKALKAGGDGGQRDQRRNG